MLYIIFVTTTFWGRFTSFCWCCRLYVQFYNKSNLDGRGHQAVGWGLGEELSPATLYASVRRRAVFCYTCLDCFLYNSIHSLFGVYRPTWEFFTYMETSPLPAKGWKCWSMLGTHGHWVACHTYCETGHPFVLVIAEDPWHTHLVKSALLKMKFR